MLEKEIHCTIAVNVIVAGDGDCRLGVMTDYYEDRVKAIGDWEICDEVSRDYCEGARGCLVRY